MSKYLTAAEILSAVDLKIEDVDVPEWGGIVRVRELSAHDRDVLQSEANVDKEVMGEDGKPVIKRVFDPTDFAAKAVARGCVDEDGKRIFDDAEAKMLGEKHPTALARVLGVLQRLSAIDAGAVAAAAKNSESAPSGASSSA